MVEGECNCGAIAFEVDAELNDVFICHCSICRRATGSNGIAVVVVEKELFSWVRGEYQVNTWKKPAADWQVWFCKICGSPVPGINDETRMFIPAGLITTGGDALAVAHHIWVGSKARWDRIGDDGQCHETAYQE